MALPAPDTSPMASIAPSEPRSATIALALAREEAASTSRNDWQLVDLSRLAERILLRAADVVDHIDFPPSALRTDLAHGRTSPTRLYSAAEMIAHAADLISQAAGAELDSEPRWRTFRRQVEQLASG
jgi:hypothetical protein